MSQIDLFKNYLYLIGPWEKKRKEKKKKRKEKKKKRYITKSKKVFKNSFTKHGNMNMQ